MHSSIKLVIRGETLDEKLKILVENVGQNPIQKVENQFFLESKYFLGIRKKGGLQSL